MVEPTAFETRLAAGLDGLAGPLRTVDALAIARAASTAGRGRAAQPRIGWLRPSRLLLVGMIGALAFVVVVAGSALFQLPTVYPTQSAPIASTTPQPPSFAPSGWVQTGSMREGRFHASATLLRDGRVLVVGGEARAGGLSLATSELYDPAGRAWTDGPNLSTRRSSGTATLLADGRVLVVGGYDNFDATASAEIYDPSINTWSSTGSMGEPRGNHTATLLNDGRVLVAGGQHNRSSTGFALMSAELYDPASGTWEPVENMARGRNFHTATLLADGRVLVAGAGLKGLRFDLDVTAELYDPATGRWTATGDMQAGRGYHTATLLPNGSVLVAGGLAPYAGPFHVDNFEASQATAELYDPIKDEWTATASMFRSRAGFAAAISGNVVLVVGDQGGGDRSAEQYDAGIAEWSAVAPRLEDGAEPLAVQLDDGTVLVLGGWSTLNGTLRSAEIYVFPN